MALVVGTTGVPVYLPAGGLSASPYGSLYGRPVIPIEQAKTAGTVGDIVLADFSQYKLIEKGGLKQDSSMHVRYIYDEQLFRFVKRMNGRSKWSNALTPANGSNTLSPFVALATRS
jgi:HK97 family phage major capsid protein